MEQDRVSTDLSACEGALEIQILQGFYQELDWQCKELRHLGMVDLDVRQWKSQRSENIANWGCLR